MRNFKERQRDRVHKWQAEGRKAFLDGKGLLDNPYLHDRNGANFSWQLGWWLEHDEVRHISFKGECK